MKIIYIGGSGRSGSTLLEMILGNLPKYCSVGEIRHFWEYILDKEILCGCGSILEECPFWRSVLQELNYSEIQINQLKKISRKINRTSNSFFLGHRKILSSPQVSTLIAATEDLYKAIQTVNQCDVIVDSSKVPSHLFFLQQIPGVEIKILHLVRDSRAVAYSWNKRRKKQKSAARNIKFMDQRSFINSILRWNIENYYIWKFGLNSGIYARVRYEDFAVEPALILNKTFGLLDIKNQLLSKKFLQEVNFKPTHSVGGNPIRFSQKSHKILLDKEWQRQMPGLSKFFWGILSLPQLKRFGYHLNS